MNTVSALITHVETAKAMEPGQGAFHDPAGAAQTTAVRATTSGELSANAARVEVVAVGLRIVGAIALDKSRPRRGAPGHPRSGGMLSTSGSSWVTSWRLALVTIAVRGMPRASVRRWCFRPFSYGDRLGSVQFFSPTQRPDRGTVHDGARQIELPALP